MTITFIVSEMLFSLLFSYLDLISSMSPSLLCLSIKFVLPIPLLLMASYNFVLNGLIYMSDSNCILGGIFFSEMLFALLHTHC